jgi:hypothetical protein
MNRLGHADPNYRSDTLKLVLGTAFLMAIAAKNLQEPSMALVEDVKKPAASLGAPTPAKLR